MISTTSHLLYRHRYITLLSIALLFALIARLPVTFTFASTAQTQSKQASITTHLSAHPDQKQSKPQKSVSLPGKTPIPQATSAPQNALTPQPTPSPQNTPTPQNISASQLASIPQNTPVPQPPSPPKKTPAPAPQNTPTPAPTPSNCSTSPSTWINGVTNTVVGPGYNYHFTLVLQAAYDQYGVRCNLLRSVGIVWVPNASFTNGSLLLQTFGSTNGSNDQQWFMFNASMAGKVPSFYQATNAPGECGRSDSFVYSAPYGGTAIENSIGEWCAPPHL